MTLRTFLGLALLAGFVLVGCAGGPAAVANYDADRNRTTYKTGPFTVARGGGSYGSSKAIDMQVTARCSGSDCTPDVAKLTFLAGGGEDLAISGTGGEIIADGTSVSWTAREAASGLPIAATTAVIEVTGKFASVEVPLGKVRAIATASSVEGSIGGMSLRIGSGVQSGLQAFLAKIDQAGTSNSGNADPASDSSGL